MSLVPFNNGDNQWDVILQDSSRQAVVLYDRNSHRMTLVNNARILSTIETVDNSTNFQDRCINCGQIVPPGRNRQHGHDFESTSSTASPIITRDVNYFQILGYRDEIQPSAIPLAPSSPIVFTPVDTPHSTPQRVPSPSASPTPTPMSERRPSGGISGNAFSQGYFDKFFISNALLGRGSRGAVYLVEHVLDGFSLGFFALKKVAVGDDHAWLEKVLSEVNLLRMLSHPNLVRYNHVWLEISCLSSFGPDVPCAFILQEYCNGGTLEEYMMKGRYHSANNDIRPKFQRDYVDPAEKIKAKRDRIKRRLSRSEPAHDDNNDSYINNDDDDEFVVQLSVREIISFMKDITLGVRYLHQNQIIHRDLKPSNCLLSRNFVSNSLQEEDLPSVLVSDFGEGQIEGLHRMGSGSTGTLEYCAPELIQTVSGMFVSEFSKETDMFSLGMILHYLCFSRLPYSNVWQEKGDLEALTGEVKQFQGFDINISNSKFHRQDLDDNLLSLLDSMISVNPERRPTANEVLYRLEEIWERYLREESIRISAVTSSSSEPLSNSTSTIIGSSTINSNSNSNNNANPDNLSATTNDGSYTSSSPRPSSPFTESSPTSTAVSRISIIPHNSSLIPTVTYTPPEENNTLYKKISFWITHHLPIPTQSATVSNKTILIKGSLFAIKLATLYNLPITSYSQIIYMMLGIELPIISTQASIAFFAAHCLLYCSA